MSTLMRVTGGGAHELSLWCLIKFWLPYWCALGALVWAVCRRLGGDC